MHVILTTQSPLRRDINYCALKMPLLLPRLVLLYRERVNKKFMKYAHFVPESVIDRELECGETPSCKELLLLAPRLNLC